MQIYIFTHANVTIQIYCASTEGWFIFIEMFEVVSSFSDTISIRELEKFIVTQSKITLCICIRYCINIDTGERSGTPSTALI